MSRRTGYTHDDEGTVYFLIRGDRIKVGWTTDIDKRLSALQDTRDDLLATIPGVTVRDEKAAHKYLWRWHIRGEWFKATAECLDAIQWLISGGLVVYGAEDRETKVQERTAVARYAAHSSWARTENRSARTAPARAALDRKFLEQAGGDPVRAAHLRKAHYMRLALKSAQVRRDKKRGAVR